jgi:hypothetical protein
MTDKLIVLRNVLKRRAAKQTERYMQILRSVKTLRSTLEALPSEYREEARALADRVEKTTEHFLKKYEEEAASIWIEVSQEEIEAARPAREAYAREQQER